MSRKKFGAESGHLTKWLPVGEIDSDPAIQRPLNQAWAERIGRELDPDKIGVIHVSKRSSGRYVTVDGQHRIHGIKHVFGDNGTLVECKVYEGLTRAQEAALFIGLNDFKRPGRIDVFLKNVIAKDEDTVAINTLVKECGFKVERNKADGNINAVSALEEVYFGFADWRDPSVTADKKAKQGRPELLRSTLNVIRGAWGGTADSVNGHIISGVGRLLAARQRVLKVEDLIHKLSSYPGGPVALVAAAAGRRSVVGGKVGVNVAEVCLDLYNKTRRVGKVDPLR